MPTCWRSVQRGGLLLLNDRPQPVGARMSWGALKEQGVAAIEQGTVNAIAVACDPPEISGAEVQVVPLRAAKDVLEGGAHPHHVTARRMQHPLWDRKCTG